MSRAVPGSGMTVIENGVLVVDEAPPVEMIVTSKLRLAVVLKAGPEPAACLADAA